MRNMLLVRSLLLTSFFGLVMALQVNGQMKIGSNPTQIHKSSILELESDRQALLLPRLQSFSDINAIIGTETKSEVVGMIVYYTGTGEQGAGLYCYQDSSGTYKWVKIASASSAAKNWSLGGNSDIDPMVNFIGTTNDQPVIIKTDKTERLRFTEDGKIVTSAIGDGDENSFEVLVLHDNGDGTGTIEKRKLPEGAFKSVITGITDKSGNTIANADATFSANADKNFQKFEVVADGDQDTISINAPIMDGTGTKTYGFMTIEDWDKLQSVSNAGYSVLNYIAAEDNQHGAKLVYDEATNTVNLTLFAADAVHAGIVTAGEEQTFGGDKTFNNSVAVTETLGVTGATTLDGVTTINNTLDVTNATTLSSTLDVDGVTTLNNALDVDGDTKVGGTLDVTGVTTLSGTTKLGSVADVAEDATTYNVLVRNDDGEVQQTTMSADAGKELALGTNPDEHDLYLDKETDEGKIIIQVPDASASTTDGTTTTPAIRGVVNTGNQTFAGEKTFVDNTTVGTAGKSASLIVNGSLAVTAKVISSDYDLSTSDNGKLRTLLVNASASPINITLPSGASANGLIYTIRIVSNDNMKDIVVNGTFADTKADGNAVTEMTFWNPGSSRTVQCQGGKWYIIAQ